MGIVGGRPQTGVRIEVERALEGGPPWRYEGRALTADAETPLRATVDAGGAVHVEVEPGAPPERVGLAERARLLLRAACKRAGPDAPPPPRRIVRWRPDA